MFKKRKKIKLENISEVTHEVSEKVEKKSKEFWKDFKKFVAKGNIIDLAIAVVIGAAFNKVVTSLVTSIITPLTGLLLKSGDIAGLKWVITPAIAADEAAGTAAVAEVAVAYGLFLQSLIDFFVIAMTIYIVLKIFIKVKNTLNRKEIEAAEAKAKAAEEKKKAEAAAVAEETERTKKEFLADVAAQADILGDIRDILLSMKNQRGDI